ncbi:PRC-barrel domain-containing protein [Adlercreutzia faecimuris]|uniref:PRC-barrel domain-containing protein n=1 Tax=Adlercreutzia faecimuris TaxID=2897341 RepID=A0ABS9WDP0_9ACTN|nr:PRC-barrel domain-containing protein [Adlercreutzia sp. JBNU-10]MCI2240979.1 PRC-barrel domain-containing protein [Adlercreutzia sp. JBNU-10]
MADHLISTKELTGLRVLTAKKSKKDPEATRRLGKVRACVFHPKEKRCVGFLVKRPDAALMFHRKDVFVAYDGYDFVDGRIVVRDDPAATDKDACKALGISWDECVLWVGLPVMCQDGTEFGLVGDVVFDAETGAVRTLEVTAGAAANTLLGRRQVPAELIRGFRYGMGAALNLADTEEETVRGAILVDDAVKQIAAEGGLAEKAGEATAVVADKAQGAIDAAKPVVSEAAAAAGAAVNKGAYATGRQISRAKGMFSGFKEEYDKASGKDDADAAAAGALASGAANLEDSLNDDVEYVYVDEDGNVIDEDDVEVVYVDEHGNVVDASEVDDPDAAPHAAAGATRSVAKPAPSAAEGAARAVGSHLKKAGGMFDAFKEEYDKARK